jgi:amidase
MQIFVPSSMVNSSANEMPRHRSRLEENVTTLEFHPTRYYNTFGEHEPVLQLVTDDTVITTTIDAGGSDSHGVNVASPGNPLTGPFFVEGAEPGDTLAVHLDRLFPNRDSGYSATAIAPHLVTPETVSALPEKKDVIWSIDRSRGTATLERPITKLGNLTIPLAPMLGCLGVAPGRGQAISSATSGPYGGNMDYRGLVAGVTLYLPVMVSGALLHLGDGHAVQGDGEIVGRGIETSFDVQFTVQVLKGKRIYWPRGEDADSIFTIGNARPLEEAVQYATTEMLRWLDEDYGLDGEAAGTLLGQCGEYAVGNIFDPAYTMVCKINKRWLVPLAERSKG